LPQTEGPARIAENNDGVGLNCTSGGVFLGGVPLLRAGVSGLAPRPIREISVLMKGGYGDRVDPVAVTRTLDVVSRALDRGDLGRAMIAAVHLRLPPLSEAGAVGIVQADTALAKYSSDEPRDERGRWTAGGGGASPKARSAQPHGRHGSAPHALSRPQSQRGPMPSSAPAGARLIPVANFSAANDNMALRVCWAASRQCQISALQDKGRTPYFAACHKAEDICLMMLPLSRLAPEQPLGVIFPDRTVVSIQDGNAMVTHLGGVRLRSPLR